MIAFRLLQLKGIIELNLSRKLHSFKGYERKLN